MYTVIETPVYSSKVGEIWLLTIYAKGSRATIPAHELRLIKEAIDNGWQ